MSALLAKSTKFVIKATVNREFSRKEYSGTVTFVDRNFVVSWHTAKSKVTQKEFELLSNILLLKAALIVKHFKFKQLYFWDAKLSAHTNLEIQIEGVAVDADKIPLDMKTNENNTTNSSKQIAKLHLRQTGC